jgi:hypothetical protein
MATTAHGSPAYAPCEVCGTPVLRGTTPPGTRVVLDTHIKTYAVLWLPDTPEPVLHESRAYPVHSCHLEEARHAP